MFDRNFEITTESHNDDVQIFSVIFGRAIRRLDYLRTHGPLEHDMAKLLFDLKCCEQIIENVCCLGRFANLVGHDEFKAIVVSLSFLQWGDEDSFLCSYLQHCASSFEDDDDDEDDCNDLGPPETVH